MRNECQKGLGKSGLVIWITGAPFSGKTSVASALASVIRSDWDRSVIHLDGDLLRLILAESFAESDSDRRALGQVYVRLAKSLGRQGHIVVVSAVAMYQEVFEELSANPACEFRAFRLNTALQVRQERAGHSAGTAKSTTEIPLDEVPEWVAVVENGNDTDPTFVAAEILEVLRQSNDLVNAGPAATGVPLNLQTEISEFGRGASVREKHWERAYARDSGITEPSSFAQWLVGQLEGQTFRYCLDFGCGNGRDAAFLTAIAPVIGVDAAETAVDLADRLWSQLVSEGTLNFTQGSDRNLSQLIESYSIDLFYSRFVWHSLTPTEELEVLSTLQTSFKPGGILAIEARTIKDPMASRGTKISDRERAYGHYRRFVNVDELITNLLGAGFGISKVVEGRGLASLGHDDPEVVRVIAVKL